jgi:hypothetical protein
MQGEIMKAKRSVYFQELKKKENEKKSRGASVS